MRCDPAYLLLLPSYDWTQHKIRLWKSILNFIAMEYAASTIQFGCTWIQSPSWLRRNYCDIWRVIFHAWTAGAVSLSVKILSWSQLISNFIIYIKPAEIWVELWLDYLAFRSHRFWLVDGFGKRFTWLAIANDNVTSDFENRCKT